MSVGLTTDARGDVSKKCQCQEAILFSAPTGNGIQPQLWTLAVCKGFPELISTGGCGHVFGPCSRRLAAGPDEIRGSTTNHGSAHRSAWNYAGQTTARYAHLASGPVKLAANAMAQNLRQSLG